MSSFNPIAFDLETLTLIPEGNPDMNTLELGISCAAAKSSDERLAFWHNMQGGGLSKEQAGLIVKYFLAKMDAGYTLVTWNGAGFDFRILATESGMREECAKIAMNHVDLMFQIVCLKGFGVGLDSVAKTMGLAGKAKSMSGKDAPEEWAAGNHDKVLGYLLKDVEITLGVAELAHQNKELKWTSRAGHEKAVSMPSLLTVKEAMDLPQPDTDWMDESSRKIWNRKRFVDWT